MNWRAFGDFMQRYGVLVAFVLLFAFSAIRQPDVFLLPENLRNIVQQNAAVGIIAVGMTLVIVTAGIDLSVGSLLALAAAVSVLVLNGAIAGGQPEGTAVGLSLVAGVVTGTVLGMLNGATIALGRVPPFVATLVGLLAYRSLTLALAEGGEIRSQSPAIFQSLAREGIPLPFITVGRGDPLVVTYPILLFFAVAGVGGFLLHHTRFGRHAIAVGANERAAIYSGVGVLATKFWAYALLGGFTGLAALTLATRQNSVTTSTMGAYFELDAIAAVVIGGTALRGGMGRVWGTVVGVLLLGVITNMLVVEGVSIYLQGVVKGLIILAAVLLQRGKAEG